MKLVIEIGDEAYYVKARVNDLHRMLHVILAYMFDKFEIREEE